MRKILLLVCLFLLFGVEITKSSAPLKESNMLTIRIDSYNRIWWNLKMVTPDNLPKLISNQVDDTLLQNDNSVYLRLSQLLKNHNTGNNRLVIVILVHQKSHYVILDNVLFIKNNIEQETDLALAAKRGCIVDSLPKDLKRHIRYIISKWEVRDTKKIDVACRDEYIVSDGLTICEVEFQFETKRNQGYWKSKIPDELFSNFNLIEAPKVGIPVPLRDGD